MSLKSKNKIHHRQADSKRSGRLISGFLISQRISTNNVYEERESHALSMIMSIKHTQSKPLRVVVSKVGRNRKIVLKYMKWVLICGLNTVLTIFCMYELKKKHKILKICIH